jgi:zinc/manganese transport system substrate-binding protein
MLKAKRLNHLLILITAVIIIIVAVGIITGSSSNSTSTSRLQVVAAENFWGSLVSQIGGSKVIVLSIVSDPNADPHEYESNSRDAIAIAKANYVIINGVGYDDWAGKLISASPNSHRVVLNVSNLVGVPTGSNPHLWYNPSYVNQAVAKMTSDLISLAPADKSYFLNNDKQLEASLSLYQNQIKSIKRQFAGTKVAATEDIFAYLAKAAGLDLISPPAFTEAVAEGNDPPAQSIVTFEQQLNQHQVSLLVYNEQTVTPLTESIKQLAADNNIPVIGVTETIQPPNETFQNWMNSEIINLENALNAQALGN